MGLIKYIAVLLAFGVVSCTTDEVYQHQAGNGNQIQIVSRVLPFNEYDVDSRAATGEDDVTMVDFIIFGKNTESNLECVFYEHSDNQIINIDRSIDFEGVEQSKLAECYVYVLVNYPGIYNTICKEAQDAGYTDVVAYINENIVAKGSNVGKGTDYFLAIPTPVQATTDVPTTGLPRFGVYDTSINLRKDAEIANGTTYQVELKCLYAKMVFNIEVDPTQDNVSGVDGNKFQLQSYVVHNLAQTVDMNGGTESAAGGNGGSLDTVSVYIDSIIGNLEGVDLTADREVSFSFYLPERFVQATTAANNYAYPFYMPNDTVREEDKKLRQRYKPELAADNATYVTFSGIFTNHQGHTFDVSYDIYVGNDNYSNFDVVRNRQYNNNITIKGIQNSSDQSANVEAISVDHRVNIRRTLPVIINLRRETLLDAHFEVRPLRIRANMSDELNIGGVAQNSAVKVEVIYADDDTKKDWIGVERSYGDGTDDGATYCNGNNSSAGKRKYFTTDLTTTTLASGKEQYNDGFSTHGGQTVVVPVTQDGECVWIYVDECDEKDEASFNIADVRSATIRVTYGTIVGGVFEKSTDDGHTVDYVINQHLLFMVETVRKEWVEGAAFAQKDTFYIEHEEEYLHNFDAEDTYESNKTEYEGMEWGLDGIQLSHQYPAIYLPFESSIINLILQIFGVSSTEEMVNNKLVEKGLNPKYDFYISRDTENEKLTVRDFSGLTFNQEIVAYLNDSVKNDVKGKIEQIALDETPQSAFAYCYNRNKRDANGKVVSQDWYMPAIDEIEDIMENAHNAFEDFHGKLYWSCQPAYKQYELNIDYYKYVLFSGYKKQDPINGFYYIDNTERARATKAEYENGVFKDVISSATDVSGIQTGELKTSSVSAEFNLGDLPAENELSFDKYPGNLPRSGVKCRVRAVRNMD